MTGTDGAVPPYQSSDCPSCRWWRDVGPGAGCRRREAEVYLDERSGFRCRSADLGESLADLLYTNRGTWER